MSDVVNKGLQVAQKELPHHDHLAAVPEDQDGGGVHAQHHYRHDGYDLHAHVEKGVPQLVGDDAELFLFIVLPDKGFYHPDTHQVFLELGVDGVDFLLDDAEQPGAHLHDNANGHHHEGDDNE